MDAEPFSLSDVVYKIPQLSASAILEYKYKNREFVHFQGSYGHVKITVQNVNDKNLPHFMFENANYLDRDDYNLLAMTEGESLDQNYRAATQMIKNFLLTVQLMGEVGSSLYYEADSGGFNTEGYPLIIFTGDTLSASPADLLSWQNTEDSVLLIRP